MEYNPAKHCTNCNASLARGTAFDITCSTCHHTNIPPFKNKSDLTEIIDTHISTLARIDKVKKEQKKLAVELNHLDSEVNVLERELAQFSVSSHTEILGQDSQGDFYIIERRRHKTNEPFYLVGMTKVELL